MTRIFSVGGRLHHEERQWLIDALSSAGPFLAFFNLSNPSSEPEHAIRKAPKSRPRRRRSSEGRQSRRRTPCTPVRWHENDAIRKMTRARRHEGLRNCQVEGHGPTCAFPPLFCTLKLAVVIDSLMLSSQIKYEVTDVAVDKLRAALRVSGAPLSWGAEEHVSADCISKAILNEFSVSVQKAGSAGACEMSSIRKCQPRTVDGLCFAVWRSASKWLFCDYSPPRRICSPPPRSSLSEKKRKHWHRRPRAPHHQQAQMAQAAQEETRLEELRGDCSGTR
jgi:hypothetical protein